MKRYMHRVEGMSARVFVGGAGEPLLLVHGGWGGAEMHWASVWEPLAARFRVVAPDLPGIGDLAHAPLGSVREMLARLDPDSVGTMVNLELIRAGQPHRVQVRIGERAAA